MSISSEITRINNNIASAYSKVEEKGGTLPGTQNSANLATAIDSISGGGGIDFAYAKIDGTQTYNQSAGIRSLITEIDMTGIKLQNMSGCFESFINLTTITNLNTSDTTNMQFTFSSCTQLKSIPQINTDKVKLFGSCFSNCSSLVDFPVINMNLYTSSNCNYMFSNCPSLSNESLNNIMASLLIRPVRNGTLKNLGLSQTQAEICTNLSNWQSLVNKGWTTGY